MTAPLKNLQESWIISNSTPIHYWHSDPGASPESPSMIHLHGFGISGSYLLPAADELAEQYRTFVPNLPGYGRSVHPGHVLSIPELGKAVIDFMDVAGVERTTLIGNSMGCVVAIEAAHAAPDRIDRLILVSPAGGPYNRPIFKSLGQLTLDGLREPPRMFTVAVPDYLKFGIINAGKLFWQMIHYPAVERLRETEKPTLIIIGERDPLVSESRLKEGIEGIEQIELVRIDGAAHAINFSHPRKLAHLANQYLEGRPLADDGESKGRAVVIKQRQPST